MEKLFIGDVFKDTGVPTHTFIEPNEYIRTKVAVCTKGKGLIVEGPSGIGKTTSIKKIIADEGWAIHPLSARKKEDVELIDLLINDSKNVGMVIIDDFHLLTLDRRAALADLLKTAADENREDIKLILINKAGEGLVKLSPDLNNRIDTIHFESNPPAKIEELISKGEKCLNIKFIDRKGLIDSVNGSFHMTQILCKEMCIMENIIGTQEQEKTINVLTKSACERKTEEFGRVYGDVARTFAVGSRIRREGRAPYFHLLMWLSQSKDWSIQMDNIYIRHPMYKQSVSQVAEKGYLKDLICNNPVLSNNIHYDENAKILTVEDPKFMFYLKNLNWENFASEIGFVNVEFTNKYDFALSFAGEVRAFPNTLCHILMEEYNYNVFYDLNERAEILGENLEEYFAPIYQSDASFVVVFMDENYANKVWTVFESKAYKQRFMHNEVLPIIDNKMTISPTDILYNTGYSTFDLQKDVYMQMRDLASILHEKIMIMRSKLKYSNN